MVLSLVIRAVGANIAVNAAQAHEFVAGILCIIFSLLLLFFTFFPLMFFFLSAAPFCSYILLWRIPIALNIVKSPASLTHTCMAFCIGIGIVSVDISRTS